MEKGKGKRKTKHVEFSLYAFHLSLPLSLSLSLSLSLHLSHFLNTPSLPLPLAPPCWILPFILYLWCVCVFSIFFLTVCLSVCPYTPYLCIGTSRTKQAGCQQ
ncbi:hypothetical protein J3F83DRAFT_735967 [Trichoderma novae-zelandiae]